MNTLYTDTSYQYCGRIFTSEEIDLIRQLISSDSTLNRSQLSCLVCDQLGWLRPNGRRKDMSCRLAMLRMHRDGLIQLPPPQKRNGNGRTRPKLTTASDPQKPVSLPIHAIEEINFHPVLTRQDSSLWNELIERYHYLGYKPLSGAQMRYLVFGGPHLLAALGFGAAAWKVAPRDHFIGWTPEQRLRNLRLVVNNSRFLILPWVTIRNLASRILAATSKRLPHDWIYR